MERRHTYTVIDPDTGKIDRGIFSDQAIYDAEMEKIFGRAWLMIGHESLVPQVNDFFHTYMGEDPVILTRDGQGRLHALLNMCRHRGNRVLRCDDGNARRFMCTYHGWTYTNDGRLEHVAGESEAYYGALDKSSLGLIQARVDTYAGIVFATWAADAPSLEAYLGDARWYLDTVFNRRDGGMQALGPMKWLEPVNWKTMVDNCSDNYHVPTSHLSSAMVQSRFLGRPRLSHKDQFESPNSTSSSTATPSPFGMPTMARPGTCTACRGTPSISSRSTTTPPSTRSSGGSASSARGRSSSATTASSRMGCWASGWRFRAARSEPSSGISCCSRRTHPRRSSG
jgi:phenylpropionate dioxygenase-like ring-hydroxylating dioxygenase large terminal subunit